MNTTSLESGAARRQAVRPAPWADVLTRRTEAFWASTYYFPTMVLLTAAGLLTGHVVCRKRGLSKASIRSICRHVSPYQRIAP